MSRLSCLSIFLCAHVYISFVSADEAFLSFDAICNYGFWVIPGSWSSFIPPCLFEVSTLDSPAEGAALVAVCNCGGHLDASVALYAVELFFVAWTVTY